MHGGTVAGRGRMLAGAIGQLSSGLVLGLSAVIYAVSYAALMFSGPLAPFIPYAITLTLIAAVIGAVYGSFAEEPTLVSGPEANTSSVLAGILAATAAAGTLTGTSLLHQALAIIAFASVFSAMAYLLIERFGLARLVRFIPFQVMAGFLASTGWLMASGALNIIAGTPLSLDGVLALVERPWRPELFTGLALVALLAWLQQRLRPAVAIPLFMIGVSLVLNVVLRYVCPGEPACAGPAWFFPPFERLQWLPPWQLRVEGPLLLQLATLLPAFLALAFVGTLTVLLSLGSLELTYQRDLALEPALRLHGRSTLAATALGGYMGLISIGRSTMAHALDGGRGAGVVSAVVCLGVLFGLGGVLAWIPKVALGALVLYLGLGMLRQWLLDLRHSLPRVEWLQVVAILLCIVAFGYVVGFLAGLLAACIFFVVNYSLMPTVRLDSTLALVRSSVIRHAADQAWLTQTGTACRVGRFEGFVFFGVAHSIYDWYAAAAPDKHPLLVLDFSKTRGIDHSAVAVLEKIVRTAGARDQRLILVLGDDLRAAFHPQASTAVEIASGFDAALERAEDLLLAQHPAASDALADDLASLKAFESAADRETLRGYLHEVRLAAGETLFREGQASDEMYFVQAGRLEVVKAGLNGGALRLSKVVPGSLIGEIALYTGQQRTATVVATEPALLLMLTREARGRLQAQHPALAAQLDHQVVLGLAGTLVRTNAFLSLQVG